MEKQVNQPKAEPLPNGARKTNAQIIDEPGIPIALLKFARDAGIDIPGEHGATRIWSRLVKKTPYEIAYLPSIQHHRVVYRPAIGPEQIIFIHVGQCTYWEPI